MPAHASATPVPRQHTPVAHWHARARLGASVSRRVSVEQWNTADSLTSTMYCLRHTALCAVACCSAMKRLARTHQDKPEHIRIHQNMPVPHQSTPVVRQRRAGARRGTPGTRVGAIYGGPSAGSAVAYGFAVGFAAGEAHNHHGRCHTSSGGGAPRTSAHSSPIPSSCSIDG